MMLNKSNILSFISLLILSMGYSVPSYAVAKLDFNVLAEIIPEKVNNLKNEVEDKINKATQDQATEVKGDKAEGKALGNKLKKRLSKGIGNIDLKDIAKSVIKGDFDFKSISSQFMSGAGLNNLSLDIYSLDNLYEDYQNEVINVRAEKYKELTQKKADLQAMLVAEKDKGKRAEIEKAIAVLDAEIEYNQTKLDDQEAQLREKRERIDEFRRAYNQAQDYVYKKDEGVKQGLVNLFSEEEENDSQNEILYGKSVNDFFLGALEYENTQNIERINKNRDTEYYRSFQKALKTAVETKVYSTDVEDKADACADISTGADTVHGTMSMRICEDIQTAKTASMFTKMLLAEVKFITAAEMIGWNDKFRLKDYNKDITRFNMDDYVLTKKDLLADKKDDLLGKAAKKIDEFSF